MNKVQTVSKSEWVGEFEYRVVGETYFRGCTRCGGTGHYSFNGFDSDCYKCGNTAAKLGVEVGTKEQAEKDSFKRTKAAAARQAKRNAEAAAALAKRDQAWAELKSAEPEVFEFLHRVATDEPYDRSQFVNDMASKLWALDKKPLTEKMITAVKKVIADRAEKIAKAVPLAFSGTRGEITGEITSVKLVESDFGSVYKIVVKDDRGFRVYGSLPSNLRTVFIDEFETWAEANGGLRAYGYGVWAEGSENEEIEYKGIKGRRISFMAKVEASDDVDFGFYSRPTKAEVVA